MRTAKTTNQNLNETSMAKTLNIIIRLPSVQAVVVWVAQPWLPDQARQVVDQMRRRNKGDSAARTNRGAGGVARAGRGQSRSGATVAIDSLSLRWRRPSNSTRCRFAQSVKAILVSSGIMLFRQKRSHFPKHVILSVDETGVLRVGAGCPPHASLYRSRCRG